MGLPRSLEVLHERSFARYLASVTVSTLGSGMATVALAFAVLDFGGATDLGIVLLAREIPIVIFLLLGGVFADRLPRRAILVGCDLLKGTTQAATAVLLFAGTANVWNVGLLQAVFGIAAAFSRPATTGIVREAVSEERLQEGNALLGLSRNILSIAAPAIGALIVAFGTPAWAIAIDAVTFFVSAALIASMHLAPTVRMVSKSIVGDLKDGWSEFVERSWVVAMVISFGLFQLTYFPALLVLGPLVAKDELGGAGAWGAVLAVESAGAVVGAIFALRVKFDRPLVACQLLVVPAGVLLVTLAVPAAAAGDRADGIRHRRRVRVRRRDLDVDPPALRARACALADQLLRLARLGGPEPDRLRADRAARRCVRDVGDAGDRRLAQHRDCLGVLLVPSVRSLRASRAAVAAAAEPAA